MSVRNLVAVAIRVLQELRRDPRTIALIVLVPPLLLTLLYFVFEGRRPAFEHVAPPLVGIFPLILMFIVTSIAMLRERTSGTLERAMSMPIAKVDLLFGYGLAFGGIGAVQGLVAAGVTFWALDVPVAGAIGAVFLVAVLNALLGTAMGLLASAYADTEFQAVQFMPAFVIPQLLLCGLFAPRDQMAEVLEQISWLLPMSYSVDAMQRVAFVGESLGAGEVVRDVVIVVGVTVVALAAAAATMRRRTP